MDPLAKAIRKVWLKEMLLYLLLYYCCFCIDLGRNCPWKALSTVCPCSGNKPLSEWQTEASSQSCQQINYLPSLLSHWTQELSTHVLYSVVGINAKYPVLSNASKSLHCFFFLFQLFSSLSKLLGIIFFWVVFLFFTEGSVKDKERKTLNVRLIYCLNDKKHTGSVWWNNDCPQKYSWQKTPNIFLEWSFDCQWRAILDFNRDSKRPKLEPTSVNIFHDIHWHDV